MSNEEVHCLNLVYSEQRDCAQVTLLALQIPCIKMTKFLVGTSKGDLKVVPRLSDYKKKD